MERHERNIKNYELFKETCQKVFPIVEKELYGFQIFIKKYPLQKFAPSGDFKKPFKNELDFFLSDAVDNVFEKTKIKIDLRVKILTPIYRKPDWYQTLETLSVTLVLRYDELYGRIKANGEVLEEYTQAQKEFFIPLFENENQPLKEFRVLKLVFASMDDLKKLKEKKEIIDTLQNEYKNELYTFSGFVRFTQYTNHGVEDFFERGSK